MHTVLLTQPQTEQALLTTHTKQKDIINNKPSKTRQQQPQKMSSSQLSALQQQQKQMRAKSIEKEIERKRQRQIEKATSNPDNYAANANAARNKNKNDKVSAALDAPAFIQSILNQPEKVDKCLGEAEDSVYELLYRDPIDYTGEHLINAFAYKPILNNNDHKDLWTIQNDKDAIQKKLKKFKENNNHNELMNNQDVAELFKTELFSKDEPPSTTTTTQDEQEQEQEQEQIIDNQNKLKKNVLKELLMYYDNGGGDLK